MAQNYINKIFLSYLMIMQLLIMGKENDEADDYLTMSTVPFI